MESRHRPGMTRIDFRSTPGMAAGTCAAIILMAVLLAACGHGSSGQGETWQRQGQLLAWDRDVWIVDTVPIIVPADLDVDGHRTLGSTVRAAGSYDARGQMVAHSVTLSGGSLPDATLEEIVHEGTITSVRDSNWVVGDMAVVLADGVIVSAAGGIDPASLASVGNVAEVTGFRFGDGTIIAIEIALREAQAPSDTPPAMQPAVTVEVSADPAEVTSEEAHETEPDINPPQQPADNRDDDGDDRDDKEREKQERQDEKDRKKDEKNREKQEKKNEKER
jgi:hypothetical protein